MVRHLSCGLQLGLALHMGSLFGVQTLIFEVSVLLVKVHDGILCSFGMWLSNVLVHVCTAV